MAFRDTNQRIYVAPPGTDPNGKRGWTQLNDHVPVDANTVYGIKIDADGFHLARIGWRFAWTPRAIAAWNRAIAEANPAA